MKELKELKEHIASIKKREADHTARALALEPLRFYASFHTRFPIFAALARKYLCVLITSVFCESFFSFAGKILSAERTSMGLETFRRLAIMKANDAYIPIANCKFLLDWKLLQSERGIVSEVIDISSAGSHDAAAAALPSAQ